MADYNGANNPSDLTGNQKETYSKKISYNVPGTGERKRFKKIKKILNIKD